MKKIAVLFFVLIISASACTKSIYVEDLTLRLEPVRTIDWHGGTPTYMYKNDYVYNPGYYVHYNKQRVTWYSDRSMKEVLSVPIQEVYKIGYRSRVLGAGVGFISGYALGFVLYNSGLLGKTNRPFLSENNPTVNLTTAAIFAGAGFSVGIPVTYIFKNRGNENRRRLDWGLGN
ncbi:hypothetical protein EP331_03185 [bacterium]|nr:MAG: hypothetical protein EP331_03185 [bacterium]